jgi:mitochondrial-processing peptidase subunit alpha
VEHFLKAVDEVSAKDITSIAQQLLSTPLTMASYGDGNFLYMCSYKIESLNMV